MPHPQLAQAIKSLQVQSDGQLALALMELGRVCLGKEFICHDESLLRFFASDRHLVGVPELALLLCGFHKKAAVAILDTFAWWHSCVHWVLFLSEQSTE